jgi:hypothetical protein
LIFLGIPVAFGGLITLLLAWLLWRRGVRGARALAVVWVVVGLAASAAAAGGGTILWAVRSAVLYPDAVSVRWPLLFYDPFRESPSPDGPPVVGTAIDQLPFARLDSFHFWLPGIVLVGVLLVAGLVVASWLSTGGRRSRSS